MSENKDIELKPINWLIDRDQYFAYSTDSEEIIHCDDIGRGFATSEAAARHAEESNRTAYGFEVSKIQVFKVSIEFMGTRAVDTGLLAAGAHPLD